jgi:hypothetical protein
MRSFRKELLNYAAPRANPAFMLFVRRWCMAPCIGIDVSKNEDFFLLDKPVASESPQ